MQIIPVILCGGSGARLWPLSHGQSSKQFLNLTGDGSLLQNTVRRAMRMAEVPADRIVTVTLRALADEVRERLAAIDKTASTHMIVEPSARNTAAAIASAALYIKRIFGGDSMIWVLPSDHHIGDEANLAEALRHGFDVAKDHLLTFGIHPGWPETGYGYIRVGSALTPYIRKASAFVEKPDRDRALAYVESGDYLWNSGMFLFTADTVLAEFEEHAPDILDGVRRAEANPEGYLAVPATPFDKAVMERSSCVAVAPCDPVWSDVGSWDSLWRLREKDEHNNAIAGRVLHHDTRNCLIHAGGEKIIACAGVDNLVIVETDHAILIADRSNGEALTLLTQKIEQKGR